MKPKNSVFPKAVGGYLCAALSAILFGLTPLVASQVEANRIGCIEITFLRGVMVSLVIGIFNLIRKEQFRISRKEALTIAVLAISGSILTTILLVESYSFIETGIATTLNFCYPVVVLVMGIVLYQEKANRHTYICFGLCMAGIIAFCNPTGYFTWKGFFLALASGVTYGFYVIYMDKSKILDTVSLWCFTFWFFAMTAILMIPVMLWAGDWPALASARGLAWSAVYSIGDGLFASLCIQLAVKRIGSRNTTLIGALEPVTSVIVGCLLFEEALTPRSFIGIALILAATTYLILSKEKTQNIKGS